MAQQRGTAFAICFKKPELFPTGAKPLLGHELYVHMLERKNSAETPFWTRTTCYSRSGRQNQQPCGWVAKRKHSFKIWDGEIFHLLGASCPHLTRTLQFSHFRLAPHTQSSHQKLETFPFGTLLYVPPTSCGQYVCRKYFLLIHLQKITVIFFFFLNEQQKTPTTYFRIRALYYQQHHHGLAS